LVFFVLPFLSYGQKYPSVTFDGKDTLLVFSIAQGKQLIAQNEERLKDKQLIILNVAQISQQDTIIASQDIKINNLLLINTNYVNIIKQKDDLISISETEKQILEKEVKRQKRQKTIVIIGSAIASALLIVVL
jgi:predicted nucleic acid-binding Zn ribbon protein